MTAMEGHAPTITTLRPGVLRAIGTDGTKAYAVTGGFAEISATGVSVLAESAIPVDEVTVAMLDDMIAGARDALTRALPDAKDAAEKTVSDYLALKVATGH